MNLIPPVLDEAEVIIDHFIRDRVKASGFEGVVLGLSGGLDSSLAMALASKTLGPENVRPVFMPYRDMNGKETAYKVADEFGCRMMVHDITETVGSIPFEMDEKELANVQARVRMLYLYSIANRDNLLVMGTSNKSELLLGYYTKYGDGASDLNPLGDLFKTQTRSLAADIGIPGSILSKPPSAGLIEGQTDEEDLELPYPIIDQILWGYLKGMDADRIAENVDNAASSEEENKRAHFEPPITGEQVQSMIQMVRANFHKRNPIPIPKVAPSTIGCDMRERW